MHAKQMPSAQRLAVFAALRGDCAAIIPCYWRTTVVCPPESPPQSLAPARPHLFRFSGDYHAKTTRSIDIWIMVLTERIRIAASDTFWTRYLASGQFRIAAVMSLRWVISAKCPVSSRRTTA